MAQEPEEEYAEDQEEEHYADTKVKERKDEVQLARRIEKYCVRDQYGSDRGDEPPAVQLGEFDVHVGEEVVREVDGQGENQRTPIDEQRRIHRGREEPPIQNRKYDGRDRLKRVEVAR